MDFACTCFTADRFFILSDAVYADVVDEYIDDGMFDTITLLLILGGACAQIFGAEIDMDKPKSDSDSLSLFGLK